MTYVLYVYGIGFLIQFTRLCLKHAYFKAFIKDGFVVLLVVYLIDSLIWFIPIEKSKTVHGQIT